MFNMLEKLCKPTDNALGKLFLVLKKHTPERLVLEITQESQVNFTGPKSRAFEYIFNLNPTISLNQDKLVDIIKYSNQIAKKTRRGIGNVLIAGSKLYEVLTIKENFFNDKLFGTITVYESKEIGSREGILGFVEHSQLSSSFYMEEMGADLVKLHSFKESEDIKFSIEDFFVSFLLEE